MAIGKPRGNKRPPSSPYPSPVTIVALVTVSLLGLWMLTSNSNSITSPSNTNIPINTSYNISPFLKPNRKIPIDIINNKHVDQENNVDVAAHDDEETGQSYKLDDDRDWLAETETENDSETEPQQEISTNNIVEDDAESLNDSDVGKQEAEEQQQEAKEEQEIEDNTDESKENHKNEATDDPERETTKQEDKENDNDEDIRDLEDTQEQETTNKEHKNEPENPQQEQEQEQDDGPIESHSIAAETKARVENQEAQDVKTKMEQAKIEPITANTTIPTKPYVAKSDVNSYEWGLCNVTAAEVYMPCLDNDVTRQCPNEHPLCLVPVPEGYKIPVSWPQSRDKIWLHNMPTKALSDFKGNQNWVKVTGEFITFLKGALHYIDFLQQAVPEIAWGKHTRVVLDIGCGVANFGGYLFDKDVLTMSFASKDDQESQVQIALERGIPAISMAMGIQRLPFPSRVYDFVHCVRCKVAWHENGGILLLEVNRLLRPGGYFVWSASPVYGTLEQDVQIWKEMSALTVAMCWELVTIKKDKLNVIGVAVYRKPTSNECYNAAKRPLPPLCKPDDDPNFAWYVPLQTCIHKVPVGETERGSQWPEEWPARLRKPPYWLNKSDGKPTPNDFTQDYVHWKRVITKEYTSNLAINWSNVRNVMDMRAVYGGFAAALQDMNLWVLNVVNVDAPDTLPIIFERGLVGIYQDWCESFSTYPRTYDLLHADRLFSKVKMRCKVKGVMAEIDRILRPEGILIARDEPSVIREMEKLMRSLNWEVNVTFVNKQGVICGRKSFWRPSIYVTP